MRHRKSHRAHRRESGWPTRDEFRRRLAARPMAAKPHAGSRHESRRQNPRRVRERALHTNRRRQRTRLPPPDETENSSTQPLANPFENILARNGGHATRIEIIQATPRNGQPRGSVGIVSRIQGLQQGIDQQRALPAAGKRLRSSDRRPSFSLSLHVPDATLPHPAPGFHFAGAASAARISGRRFFHGPLPLKRAARSSCVSGVAISASTRATAAICSGSVAGRWGGASGR